MTAPIHGWTEPRFDDVRAAFAENFESHGDVGAAVAVYLHGEPVIDLWGGWHTPEREREWDRNTLVNVFSTTKGLTAFCAHRLVEQGLLDVDAPVAEYWPEFAAAGKAEMPVRYLLNHAAGLAAVREPIVEAGLVRLGQDDVPAGRPGAVLGARRNPRLPRDHLRLARGRGGPPDRRPQPRHVLARGVRSAARARCTHRHRPRVRRPDRAGPGRAARRRHRGRTRGRAGPVGARRGQACSGRQWRTRR